MLSIELLYYIDNYIIIDTYYILILTYKCWRELEQIILTYQNKN